MGKVEDLRAMREARYERNRIPGYKNLPIKKADTSIVKAVLDGQLCGHKGVSGKSCTRPKDHEEKNHRYK